ncbi:MAG: DUF1800 domain-containing protein [Planctomycetota bacterium]|nr:DUF1800 domain-containing protein [Planctomycetota bacterium]MDA1113878.1 DUF1800 domain-containing protein [Planctomycetota bacterium]
MKPRHLLVSSCLSLFATATLAAQEDAPAPLTEQQRAAHVLSRLAYGPRPGEIDRLVEMGVDVWLKEQFSDKASADPRLAERMSEFQTLSMGIAECISFTATPPTDKPSVADQRLARRKNRIPMEELMESIAFRAVFSERQATEVMAEFWRNHFNVSFTKGQDIYPQMPDYEREVIQKHVWGSFPDMLTASATHPAMLNYLDNSLSRRPPSKQQLAELERRTKRKTGSEERATEAVQIASQRGLNENYGRELLELHTLGVDNFYKQKDVIAVAECLTGWTIDGGREGTRKYVFDPDMHVDGNKQVLGKLVREDKDGGPGQGMDLLEMLGKHKGTADFIAMKMVRFLVADVPPENLVEQVAKTYRKTDGDMTAMVQTIVESEEFWDPSNVRSKFKTPYEFIISSLRVTGCEIGSLGELERYLVAMGQPIYNCDDPTGYYDTSDVWLDPGVMALRWEFAVDLANGKVDAVAIPDAFYDQVPADVPPRLWQHHLTQLILPGGAGARTRAALATVTSEYLEKKKVLDLFQLGPELVGLLLGSPEFQQQ